MSEEIVKKNKKNKKPNWFARSGRWIAKKCKETVSELKKVTWPKFPKVVKQTAVVLGVILLFLIIITGLDYGFGALLKLVKG